MTRRIIHRQLQMKLTFLIFALVGVCIAQVAVNPAPAQSAEALKQKKDELLAKVRQTVDDELNKFQEQVAARQAQTKLEQNKQKLHTELEQLTENAKEKAIQTQAELKEKFDSLGTIIKDGANAIMQKIAAKNAAKKQLAEELEQEFQQKFADKLAEIEVDAAGNPVVAQVKGLALDNTISGASGAVQTPVELKEKLSNLETIIKNGANAIMQKIVVEKAAKKQLAEELQQQYLQKLADQLAESQMEAAGKPVVAQGKALVLDNTAGASGGILTQSKYYCENRVALRLELAEFFLGKLFGQELKEKFDGLGTIIKNGANAIMQKIVAEKAAKKQLAEELGQKFQQKLIEKLAEVEVDAAGNPVQVDAAGNPVAAQGKGLVDILDNTSGASGWRTTAWVLIGICIVISIALIVLIVRQMSMRSQYQTMDGSNVGYGSGGNPTGVFTRSEAASAAPKYPQF